VKIDVCTEFSGAMGGVFVDGTFTLARNGGSVTGTASGYYAFEVPNRLVLTLTISGASSALKSSIGDRLYLTGHVDEGGGAFSGAQLTTTQPQ
jgi:hypothetical protein